MNVYLTPIELLHVFETAIQKPHTDSQTQESLLSNLRKPILDALEDKQTKIDEDLYVIWTENESKKIEELNKKNLSINPSKSEVARSSRGRR